jgi:predicted Fe-Mo cluster-binding NifX family protein
MGDPRIVITVAGGRDLEAEVDPAFGRAECFLVVTPPSEQVLQVIENSAKEAAHGAGVRAAELVGDTGADAVIAGAFGPKAASALRAKGIAMYECPRGTTARQAVQQYRAGRLSRL